MVFKIGDEVDFVLRFKNSPVRSGTIVAFHDWIKTYQHYHPAVTLMWIMGVPIEVLRHFSKADRVYTYSNFETFHIVAKVSLVMVQLVLTFIIFHLLARLFGYYKAFFATVLFTFEPFFVGNSRLLHMDVLLAQFLLIALILVYLQCQSFS